MSTKSIVEKYYYIVFNGKYHMDYYFVGYID